MHANLSSASGEPDVPSPSGSSDRTGRFHPLVALLAFLLPALFLFRFLQDVRLFALVAVLPAGAYILFHAVRRPFWAALPVVVAIWLGGIFYLAEGASIPVTPFQLLFLPAFGLWVILTLVRRDTTIRVTGLEGWTLLFVADIFLMLIFSGRPDYSLLNAVRFLLQLLLILYLLNQITTRTELLITLASVSVVAAAIALYSAAQALLNPEITALNLQLMGKAVVGRSALTDSDPNFFAATFFLPMMFTAAVLHSKLDLHVRAVAAGLFALLAAGLIATYSRGAWVAVFLALLIVVARFRNPVPALLALGAATFYILLNPDLLVTLFSVLNRLSSLFGGSLDSSSSTRVLLGIGALEMTVDSWGLGVGFGSFPIEFKKLNMGGLSAVSEPHNMLYQVLAEQGVHGFLILLVLMAGVFKTAIGNVRRSHGEWDRVLSITLLSGIVSYVLLHQFIPRFLTNTMLMATIAFVFAHRNMLLASTDSNADDEADRGAS